MIGWFALVPASIASMAITMQINDDPNADAGLAVVFTVAAAVFTLGAGFLFKPMLESGSRARGA